MGQGHETPSFIVPLNGKYLWEWYISLNECVPRIYERRFRLIPPSELHFWSTITGNLVYPVEYDILIAMDVAFCDEMNKEIISEESKAEEQRNKQVEKPRRK